MKDIIKDCKLTKDIKKEGVGKPRVTIKSKVTTFFNNAFDETVLLWRLIVTIAQAIGAYILIPQSALGYKVIGGILLTSAISMAVNQYHK